MRVVLARDADELLEVLEPALGLDRALGLERVEVAGLGERLLEQVADRRAASARSRSRSIVDMKRPTALTAAAPRPGIVLGRARDVPDRLADRVRVRDDPRLRGVADAAPRRVDDALERDDVAAG